MRLCLKEMWLFNLLVICISFFTLTISAHKAAIACSGVLQHCQKIDSNVPRCLEHTMRNCDPPKVRFQDPNLYMRSMDLSEEAKLRTEYGHVIHIPPEALMRSAGMNDSSVSLVVSVLSKNIFQAKLRTEYGHVIHIPPEALMRSAGMNDSSVSLVVSVLSKNIFQAPSAQGSVHENVLGVWLGEEDLHNLSQPVQMQFVNTNRLMSGKCVFWKQSNNIGLWSSEGCNTSRNNTDFVCSCNHLSFFAVLISPGSVLDAEDIRHLEYISYIGSSFSVIFTAIIIMLFLIQRKKKTEHSVIIHVQLSGSLFLLHLFFLASTLGSGTDKKPLCQCLGLILHWALLATFTWTAIEGFHLYLLLVRVFNIYIRRYLLKLSLVGWGAPVILVVICGLAGEYGKYSLTEHNNKTDLCWIANTTVSYVTVNGYLGLVLLFNTAIMIVIVVKIWQLKLGGVKTGNKIRQLWKDLATMLGLSVVLGLPWGLAFSTYGPLSLAGTYLFTSLNAFQGFFVFLWYLSITCKATYEERNSTKAFSLSNFSS